MQTVIRPQTGRQEQFLLSPADIVIYGGAAGGGKTWSLLLQPLRHIHNADFGALILRRSYPQIMNVGGMWSESEKIYPHVGGDGKESKMSWQFQSGAVVSFGHMFREADKSNYQGAQIPLIEFDQLEQFSESQFWYMLSRNRSMCGVRPYIRATANPEPNWLAELLDWWIADDGYADLDRAGIIRWFIRQDNRCIFSPTEHELKEKYPDSFPKSITFIPASVYDNKILLETNPEYLANLQALDAIERERLLGDAQRGGNWKIKPSAGKLFNEAWYEIVDAVPPGGIEVRRWDFAATERETKGSDPDYTASTKMRFVNGMYYVVDSTEDRIDAGKTDTMMMNLARQDAQYAARTGARYMVRWEQEPGASGKRDTYRLVKMLAGFDAQGIRSQGDKVTRARPFSAMSEAGGVKLLKAPWNQRWLTHMHHQPDIAHDDIMDATTGAFNDLANAQSVWTRGMAG
jgi:predicted phage terminase large subunit-like protein